MWGPKLNLDPIGSANFYAYWIQTDRQAKSIHRLSVMRFWLVGFAIADMKRAKWTSIYTLLNPVLPEWSIYKLFRYRVYQKKHGNSVTNLISSLLWISIVIPNFKSHNIIMSARVYFMKRVKDCKDVSISARWTVKTDKFTLFVFCNLCGHV